MPSRLRFPYRGFRYIGLAQWTNTSNGSIVLPAYARPFLSFNMTVLFNYKQ